MFSRSSLIWYLKPFNYDSESEFQFESSSNNKFIYQELSSQAYDLKQFYQGPTEPYGVNQQLKEQVCCCNQTTQHVLESMKYKNKIFPTLSLKKLIVFFRRFPQSQQEEYQGFIELLQEEARMKREKRQVTFARRHHIKLNKCLASAQLYCKFLKYDLMPAFQQSKRIKDASIYLPCITKFLELSNKVQRE